MSTRTTKKERKKAHKTKQNKNRKTLGELTVISISWIVFNRLFHSFPSYQSKRFMHILFICVHVMLAKHNRVLHFYLLSFTAILPPYHHNPSSRYDCITHASYKITWKHTFLYSFNPCFIYSYMHMRSFVFMLTNFVFVSAMLT